MHEIQIGSDSYSSDFHSCSLVDTVMSMDLQGSFVAAYTT